MDFSEPLSVVTPTLDAPVLRVLASTTRAMTRGEIVRLVGSASLPGVRKVLARLVQQGVVSEDRVGRQFQYVANRQHLAWPSIELLTTSVDRLVELVNRTVQTWSCPVVSVAFFGSMPEGRSDVDSDLDLMIVGGDHDNEGWQDQVAELTVAIETWTGNEVDVLEVSVTEFLEMGLQGEPVIRAPRRHVSGLDLGSLPPPPDVLREVLRQGQTTDLRLQALLDARSG